MVMLFYFEDREFNKLGNEHYDTLRVLSEIKIGEIDNNYVKYLIDNDYISDLNKSVLEQIGEFYVTNITLSKELANYIINYTDTKRNIGIWYGDTLVASKNNTSYEEALNIAIARETISGIREGGNLTGYSARAYLTNNLQTKYFYFGGYVGDGNITIYLNYSGNISFAQLEIGTNKNFSLYINNKNVQNYTASISEFIPIKETIPTSEFVSGNNILELKGDSLRLAGGFIKIVYEAQSEYKKPVKYYFPGIEGLINLYDGFYIPGNLTDLEIRLHLINNQTTTFLNIGNVTIYNSSTNGEEIITLTNSNLSSLLNYSQLSYKNIPLRLGLENVSYVKNLSKKAEVFSVTDLSGSMSECGTYSVPYTCNYNCVFGGSKSCTVTNISQCTGNPCGGTCWFPNSYNLNCDETKIELAIQSNKDFIDMVLNISDNRSANKVGLVGYKGSASSTDYHNLSNNTISLKSKVDSWTAGGSTCICCGINKAVGELINSSSPTIFQSLVVMSDGEANVECSQQGTGNAKQDAINAACSAYDNYGITVYSIGFGADSDEATLQAIASCGNGAYFFSSGNELSDIYRTIAKEILEATYYEQTVEASQNIYTKLFPDSYIQFNYTYEEKPYGILINLEKQFDNDTYALLNIPQNGELIEAVAISYSGSRWTDSVKVNETEFYNLKDYGRNYLFLGDPYAINIPVNLINLGNNLVKLTTAIDPSNSTHGSSSNKIIYTFSENMTSFSKISPIAQGCNWSIQFEDGTNTTINYPQTYTGNNLCNYTSQNIYYEDNDAYQIAVYKLLSIMDTDKNKKIDIKFSSSQLQVSLSEISGIPYTWSTEVKIKLWN
jgi:hypothetical protein